jgi:hypothetical protein
MERLPKTKKEIEQLVIARLHAFDCEDVSDVVIIPLVCAAEAATWTVSCFRVGDSDKGECDRALQHIVPHLQQMYDLVQKH